MQGCNPSINMYDRDILEDIRRKLMTFGNDAFDMFREGPFRSFLQFRWENSTSRAFFVLLSHEVDVEGTENELWFRVGETNIRFGAREFALMTGLEFNDSGFDPTARHEMPEHSCLSYYGGICPSVNDLYRDFSSSEIVLSNSMEDYVKIANLLFAYLMLVCLDGKRAVDLWAAVLVEDAEGWRTFPWGSWSYGVLLHQMSRVKREFVNPSARNLLHAYDPVWVLQVDHHSCGAYCMMHLDRFVMKFHPPDTVGSEFVGIYRRWVAARIHHMCKPISPLPSLEDQ